MPSGSLTTLAWPPDRAPEAPALPADFPAGITASPGRAHAWESDDVKRLVRLKSLYFTFFVISGACSLVYEIAWLRLAMANFGLTTPMVSIVISVFMAGLGLGSWAGGTITRGFESRSAPRALRFYALLELLIGLSGIAVIPLLSWARLFSERIQNAAGLGSQSLYFVTGILVALVLLPWCTAMGATIPFFMSAIAKSLVRDSERSFSFLYLANVLGAVLGCLVPALVLFELLGFQRTLYVTALLNGLLATGVLLVSMSPALATSRSAAEASSFSPSSPHPRSTSGKRTHLLLLFLTGFVSMALEVIWIRQFTPYLGSVVYTFALILAFYLIGTFEGSSAYRIWDRVEFPTKAVTAWVIVGLCALFALISSDPRVVKLGYLGALVLTFVGIAPFSGVIGFLTPMLVDDWSGGNPERAGRAYGVNVLGCILGPLFAGFCILPWLGERRGTILLAVPLLLAGLFAALGAVQCGSPTSPESNFVQLNPKFLRRAPRSRRMLLFAAATVLASILIATGTEGFAEKFKHREVRRDYTATVIAAGEGMNRNLLVNGVGITKLSPVTKMMADLPLAFLTHPPRNGLVICFGMGTTFRSMLSWGIPTTAVELVPSVPQLFGYFHPDGPELLKSRQAHIVIDDGRRFLERTSARYDVIAIDPPPPVEAASSSLLYSREFYSLAKKHLYPGGILQQWLPGGDAATRSSVAQALRDSFPYVRVFRSVQGIGYHFLASDSPIPVTSASTLASRMPRRAVADMLEWGPHSTPQKQLQAVLSTETSLDSLIAKDPSVPALSDDRPVNEYYALRRWLPSAWIRNSP